MQSTPSTPPHPFLTTGHALADIIFGAVNPSARLPITLANRDNETDFTPEQFPGVDGRSIFSEKLLVGYRYYDSKRLTPKYPFGHGNGW